MVMRLGEAKRAGQLLDELGRLGRIPLLIVDEVGYIPFDPDAASLPFQLVSSRKEKSSLIVLSNKNFSAWAEILETPPPSKPWSTASSTTHTSSPSKATVTASKANTRRPQPPTKPTKPRSFQPALTGAGRRCAAPATLNDAGPDAQPIAKPLSTDSRCEAS